MKQLLLIISLLFIGCGTDQEGGKLYKYSIKNESGKKIKINSYRNSYPVRNTPIFFQLSNGENITKIYESSPPPQVDIYNFVGFFDGDSLVINYNNEKKQIFTFPTENDRNPFFYTGTDVTYIFTDASDDLLAKSTNSKNKVKTCHTMNVLNKQIDENPGLAKKIVNYLTKYCLVLNN